MPNNGAVNHELPANGSYTIPKGYHDGSGKVTQDIPTQAAKTITPSASKQTVSVNGKLMTGDIVVNPIPNIRGQSQMAGGWGSGGTGADAYFAMNDIPEGYYQKNGDDWAPEIRMKQSDVRAAIGATDSSKWRKDVTIAGLKGTMTEQGGSTITPGTKQKTAVSGGRYVTGDILVAGDADLVPANIVSGKNIFGVAGSARISYDGPGNIYEGPIKCVNLSTSENLRPGNDFPSDATVIEDFLPAGINYGADVNIDISNEKTGGTYGARISVRHTSSNDCAVLIPTSPFLEFGNCKIGYLCHLYRDGVFKVWLRGAGISNYINDIKLRYEVYRIFQMN